MKWNELAKEIESMTHAERDRDVIALRDGPDHAFDPQTYVLRIDRPQHFYMSPTLILQCPEVPK